jgi:hypothetical protein
MVHWGFILVNMRRKHHRENLHLLNQPNRQDLLLALQRYLDLDHDLYLEMRLLTPLQLLVQLHQLDKLDQRRQAGRLWLES